MGGKRLRRTRTGLFWLIFAAFFLCAAVLAAAVLLRGGLHTESSPPAPANETAPQAQIHMLQGTVADSAMQTILVAADDGTFYRFDHSAAKVSAGQEGILVGCPVTVTYRGTLDPELTAQQVEVLSISVGSPADSPAEPSETEEPASLEEQARTLLAGMSLEEKVGQMFLARCPKEDGTQLAADYHLGGYLLFGRDFSGKTPEEVTQAISAYQQAASIPMLIGVDEEGGSVVRISKYPAFRDEPFPAPQELFRQGGLEAVREDAAEKGQLLRSLGIHVNFAPVCDVSQNPEDFIFPRTLGADAGQTAQYVQAVVEVMQDEGIACVLKHFPGYGGNADTHTGIAYDSRPLEAFQQSDFLPFQAGIQAGADLVLVSHNIVACMDSQLPASLSPEVHRILREDLGFSGVVITDDLVMDGIRDFAGTEQAAVLAVQAGNDLLCSTDFQAQIPAVLRAVERGEISEARIDQSVLRILELKLSLGLLPQQDSPGAHLSAPFS